MSTRSLPSPDRQDRPCWISARGLRSTDSCDGRRTVRRRLGRRDLEIRSSTAVRSSQDGVILNRVVDARSRWLRSLYQCSERSAGALV